MGSAVFGCNDLAFDATCAETGADDETCQACQFLGYVLVGDLFAVDKDGFHLVTVVCACMGEAFKDTFVGVLQVIFADQSDLYDFGCLFASFQKVAPRSEFGRRSRFDAHLLEADGIKSLMLHVDGHFVDAGQVLALDDSLYTDVAEVCHLGSQFVAQSMLCTQHQYFGLNAQALQLLHTGLCRLGLQFACCGEVGYVGQMNVEGTCRTQFPSQLSDGFEKGLTFDVADGAAYLCDNEVERTFGGIEQDATLDFVGDVWHDLDGLAEIVATTFALDDAEVDAPCGDTIVACGFDAGETFVVSQVEIGLHAIGGDIAFAVLVGVECAGVDVDVGVELLDGNLVAPCLEQFAERSRDDALSQRRGHTTGDEDVLGFHNCC